MESDRFYSMALENLFFSYELILIAEKNSVP